LKKGLPAVFDQFSQAGNKRGRNNGGT